TSDPKPAADPLGVKPAAGGATPAPTVPPVAESPARRPPTVDVYDPRPGDRYEGVSREYYGDGRYAAALQAYNGNRPIQPGQSVDVPPVHVLKKRFPQMTGVPASAGRPTPAADWQTAAADPTFRPGRPRTFAVPAGGMSMRAVAREALGDPQRWEEVYNLNRAYDPGLVPGGVQLQLPAGGRPPE
ncbi:MAG: hypothetical protein K2X82_00300, partial [Gemmataceae bacterium]|nr:hypothetical protein [Gemmataceae bacterium]